MSDLIYRPLTSQDQSEVKHLIKLLYADDPHGEAMTDQKIDLTFEMLTRHPDYGTIVVFEQATQIVGYAILINFWSNEYGGNVLTIDELVVVPEYRNRGIGTAFIKYIQSSRFANFVALRLEVLPYNTKALQLYTALGFTPVNRHHLIYER